VQFGHVAINASAADFRRGDFAERLLGHLAAADIPPHRLQLEVTETIFLGRGGEDVGRALNMMHAAGIQIALDDFGTGYSSLSHLKQFPVSIIKIDRSFVRDLHEDANDEAIVRAVISLGQSLGIKVVAEGVETPAQSAYLRKYSCDYGQGYMFGAAAAAAAVPALVEQLARQGSSGWQDVKNGELPGKAEPQVRIADQPATAPRSATGAADRAGEEAGSDRNVYIVDDDREIRESTSFLLQAMGYRCRTFASGAAFLRAFLELAPGCVLLDVRMDGLDGQQVLSELRWMHSAWAVVVMSGHLDDVLAASLRAAGAHTVLAKPFDETVLCRALDAIFMTMADGTGLGSANSTA
jgi:CheY-like chemotaxis protein